MTLSEDLDLLIECIERYLKDGGSHDDLIGVFDKGLRPRYAAVKRPTQQKISLVFAAVMVVRHNASEKLRGPFCEWLAKARVGRRDEHLDRLVRVFESSAPWFPPLFRQAAA